MPTLKRACQATVLLALYLQTQFTSAATSLFMESLTRRNMDKPLVEIQRPGLDTSIVFRGIVVVSTALGFGAVFGSLACLQAGAHSGIDFRWRWSAVLWILGGNLAACYFWNLVWRAQADGSPKAQTRLARYCVVVIAGGLAAFAYPIRFVAEENLRDVLIGLAMAAAVLILVGWMMFRLVRLFADEKPEKRR